MISPQYVDGLEQRIKELTHERGELSEQLKTSRRDYDVMNKFREGAEAERDALAAHVERLRTAWRQYEDSEYCSDDEIKAEEQLHALMEEDPETSLARLKAEWQAEALEELLAFRSAVTGWRENDWPEWFCRRTAEAVADRGRQAEGGVRIENHNS